MVRQISRRPLWLLSGLWATAMLTPFLMHTPLPGVLLHAWRQDFLIAALLAFTTMALLFCIRLLRARSAKDFWLIDSHEKFALLALALFIGWSATSSLWAKSSFAAIYYAAKWIGFALFFVLMRRAASQPRLLRLALCSLAAVVSIVGLICLGDAWMTAQTELPRLTGFGEPQAMAVSLFAALALHLRRQRAALLCGVTAALAWAGMLQMWQRTALLAASVSLLALIVGSITFSQFRPRSFKRLAMVCAGFLLATMLQAAPSWVSHEETNPSIFARTGATLTAENLNADSNTSVRFLLWSISFDMWRTRPLTGVGANNFEVAYAEARRAFVAHHPGSPLLNDREDLLAQRAHNEYLQMLAELGAPGLLLFLLFCGGLVCAAWRALHRAQSPLALGATCSLIAFAISSGASSASFRWFMSGLMFFFAAALVFRFAATPGVREIDRLFAPGPQFSLFRTRLAILSLVIASFFFLYVTGRQAAVAMIRQAAQTAETEKRAEQLYRLALHFNESDAQTHFAYGMWLFGGQRYADASRHLRHAVEQGFSDAGTYSFLASAEAEASDERGSAATMEAAERTYPRSIYVRVRHAAALAEAQMEAAARDKFAEAAAMDGRQARGWWYLLSCGQKCASRVARADKKNIALAGELTPLPMIDVALLEAETRPPRVTLPPWPILSYAVPE